MSVYSTAWWDLLPWRTQAEGGLHYYDVEGDMCDRDYYYDCDYDYDCDLFLNTQFCEQCQQACGAAGR